MVCSKEEEPELFSCAAHQAFWHDPDCIIICLKVVLRRIKKMKVDRLRSMYRRLVFINIRTAPIMLKACY